MTGRPHVRAQEILPAAGVAAGVPRGTTSVRLTGPSRGITQRKLPTPLAGRFRRGRRAVSAAASAVLVAAIFGFALPHFASYRSVWASFEMMTWPQVLLVVVAAAASLAGGWLVICSVLPSVRLREAAVVNLGSTAAANALPAGGALAMGISWTMLSSWGVSAADYVLYTLVSGIWNVLARLGLPAVALMIMMTVRRPQAGLLAGAVAGLVLLVIVAAGFGLLLRSESFAIRADTALRRALTVAWRLARRPPPSSSAGCLQGFRERAAGLLAARGWRITAATAVGSHRTVAGPAGERTWSGPLPVPGAVADVACRVRVRPSADRPASHAGRRRHYRARPCQHPGRGCRPQNRRAGNSGCPALPGCYLPGAHSQRGPSLHRVAVCARPQTRRRQITDD
jgi:hypothetical protein